MATQRPWLVRMRGFFAYLQQLGWLRKYSFMAHGQVVTPIGCMTPRQHRGRHHNDNYRKRSRP